MKLTHFILPLALLPVLFAAGIAVVLWTSTLTLVLFSGAFFLLLVTVLQSFMRALAEAAPPKDPEK